MASHAFLAAFLVMLRVSGLAPDLPWGWALFPMMVPAIILTMGILMVIGCAVASIFKGAAK